MCDVFCVLALLRYCCTARHGASRHVTARLRFVDGARVSLLAMTRMNGTMATNGLRDGRMQCCHGWWRLFEHRFRIVSCLFVVFLSCSCVLRQCVLLSACFHCCGAASRHGMARLVASRRGCGLLTRLLCGCWLRRKSMAQHRSMACGTNECSSATVDGGKENDASAP